NAQIWTAIMNDGAPLAANGSPGTGLATVSLSGSELTVNISFSGLVGTSTASHIHCCTTTPFNGTAGVATPVPTFPGFPLGVQSGTYSQIFDLMLPSSYNPAFLTAHGDSVDAARIALIDGLNSGNAYANVHTKTSPGGEIAGYLVTSTPEPGSALLLTPGLIALAGVVRRRRTLGGNGMRSITVFDVKQ
ncbi:MAG: CHRD domain-containing protein, partial [Bryocella sp.]